MDLDIVVVSHNHGQYLQRCLSSVFLTSKIKLNLTLIINNSKDRESLKIAKKFPRVKTIINKTTRGLASNINQGIKVAKGEYILVLNPDTVATEGAIEILINFMKNHPKAGICGPGHSLDFLMDRFRCADNCLTYLINKYL